MSSAMKQYSRVNLSKYLTLYPVRAHQTTLAITGKLLRTQKGSGHSSLACLWSKCATS